mgnify:FL=1
MLTLGVGLPDDMNPLLHAAFLASSPIIGWATGGTPPVSVGLRLLDLTDGYR